MNTSRYHITHEELTRRIKETYGPYSSESLTFCDILNQLQKEKNLNSPLPKKEQKQSKDKNNSRSMSVELPHSKEIWRSTLAYFFARSAFILGTWALFVIVTGLLVFGAFTFLL